MLLTLSAKKKAGFVNGTIKKPVDDKSPEYVAWERCNGLVCSILMRLLLQVLCSSEWLDLAQIYALEQSVNS